MDIYLYYSGLLFLCLSCRAAALVWLSTVIWLFDTPPVWANGTAMSSSASGPQPFDPVSLLSKLRSTSAVVNSSQHNHQAEASPGSHNYSSNSNNINIQSNAKLHIAIDQLNQVIIIQILCRIIYVNDSICSAVERPGVVLPVPSGG